MMLVADAASAATAPTVTIYTAEHYFSPNGDASDDLSAIGYCINSNVAGGGLSQQVLITVVITDSANTVVRTLETGVAHDSNCFSQVDWDGRNGQNTVVANGVYTVHIHAQNTDGAISDSTTHTGVDVRLPATVTQPAAGSTVNGTVVAFNIVPTSGATLLNAAVTCTGLSATTAFASVPAGDGSLSGTWSTDGCTDGANAVHAHVTWTDALGGNHDTPLANVALTSTDPPTVVSENPIGDHRYFTPNGDGSEDTADVHYCLDQDATVDVTVLNAANVVIRTLEAGVPHSAKACQFGIFYDITSWDGRNSANVVVADGTYTVRVHASSSTGADTSSVQVGVRTTALGSLTQPAAGATLTGTVSWKVTPAGDATVTGASVTCDGTSAIESSSTTLTNGTFDGSWDTTGCSGGAGAVHSFAAWTDGFGQTHPRTPLPDIAVSFVNAPAVTIPFAASEHRYFTPDGDSFDETTTVGYCVSQDASVDITVTDAGATVVRTIEDAVFHPASVTSCLDFSFNQVSVTWDGKNDGGDVVPDGVYTLHITASNGAGVNSATLDLGVSTTPPAHLDAPAAGATLTGTIPWRVVPAAATPLTQADVTCTGAAAAIEPKFDADPDGAFTGTWDTTGCAAGPNAVVTTVGWVDPFGAAHTTVLPPTPMTSANPPTATLVNAQANRRLFNPTAGESGAVSYCVNQDSAVDVTVVNSSNAVVRTLASGTPRTAVQCHPFTATTDTWDGKDGQGSVVPDGVYTINVHAHNAFGSADVAQQLGVETSLPGAITSPASGGTLAGLATLALTPTPGFAITQVDFSVASGGNALLTSADADGVWRARVFTGSLTAGPSTLSAFVTWTNVFGDPQSIGLAQTPVVVDNASLPLSLGISPAGGPAPLATTITLDTSDPQGRDVSYTIDFGDGSTVASGTLSAPYLLVTLTHTFAVGTFHVHATVNNGQGGSSAKTVDVSSTTTASSLPTPSLALDVASGVAPLPLTATLAAGDSDSPNLTYGLVWGDGTTAATGTLTPTTGVPATVQHTFTAAGSYTVTLSVSDGAHTTQVSQSVVVTTSGPPPASITTTLTPSVTTVGPGAVSMPVSAIPTEALKTIGADVSNAPNLRRAPGIEKAPNLRRAPLEQVAASLNNAPNLRRAPLPQITVLFPGGWPALLQGTPLADVPAQSLTLGDVLALLTAAPPQIADNSPLHALTLGDLQLDGSPLDAITPAGLQLGATPVASLIYADGAHWCDKLAASSPHHETCASLSVTPTTSLIALDLRPAAKAVLDAVPLLRRPPLAANVTTFHNANAAVVDARLDEENLVVTRIGDLLVAPSVALVAQLAALPIAGIPSDRVALVVTCGGGLDCAHATLGDAAAASRIVSGARLVDLQRGLATVTVGDIAPALPASIEVNDVITGFLDAADFPWETLDLLTAGFQEFAPGHPSVHWVLGFHADGGSGPWTTTATADLPPGWRILSGSVTTSGLTRLGKPLLQQDGTGSHLRLTLGGTQPGTSYSIGFDAVPPLALGTNPATATVTVAGGTNTSADADVTVVEDADPSATPANASALGSDVLYFGHIASPGDVDLFSHTPAAGANDGVRLSHLAGDADLVLYGPPTDAAGSGPSAMNSTGSGPGTPPLADAGYTGADQVAQPQTDADLTGIPGLTVAATSATRSDTESATADNVHLVEVRSYNGATSNLPYVLRIRETVPAPEPSCPAYARTGGTAGSFNPAALPARVKTLVLVNGKRMGDTYPGADVGTMMSALQQLAADPSVQGAVIPVEGDGTVASAYGTWNANPCSATRANNVVAAIDGIIKQVRTTHTELANIVVVGNDDMIPMARLSDATRWGNESSYADALAQNTALHGALASGHTLSDDPYGDLDPIPWLDRRLYVPDLAVGRLVETPSQITAQANLFLTAHGVLDPSSAYSAGYDFMSDGADAVGTALSHSLAIANGGTPPTITTRINGTWTSSDLMNDLAGGPGVASIDGHFDHNSGLAAAGFANGGSDTFTAAQLAAALPAGARLVLSMGCHAGLSVPDAGESASIAVDNAAALAQRGAVFLAATGFGYGDQATVGLHERLMTLFADQLDGSVSIGQAAWQAKQDYFATEGLYGAYDEKVLSSTVLYGLPMWTLTATPTVRPSPTDVVPVAAGGGISTLDRTIASTFTRRSGSNGDWFEVDKPAGGTFAPQATPGRPLQPRVDADVTAASNGALLPAHGALVTSLTSLQAVADFPAALSRPTVDESTTEPADTVTDLAFPSSFASLTTSTDPQGPPGTDGVPRRQRLVIVPGQFRGTAGNGSVGRQDLFSTMGVRIYYSTASDDAAPTFTGSDGTVDTATNIATFDAQVGDASGVVRVLVLYDAGSGWHPLDLGQVGAGHWRSSTGIPDGVSSVRYIVQAVDAAGNVGASTGKGAGIVAAPPTAPGAVAVTFTPALPASGVFGAVPTIGVAGTGGVTYKVTVDAQPEFTYAGPFIAAGLTTGTHTVHVHGADGADVIRSFTLDLAAPTINASVTPAANAAGWRSSATTVTFTCADVGSGVAHCAAPVTISTDVRARVVTGSVTDQGGNGASVSVTVNVDRTAPAVATPAVRPATPTAGQAVALTAAASDGTSGVAAGEWFVGTDPGVGKAARMSFARGVVTATAKFTAGRHLVGVRSRDVAGHWSATRTRTITVLPRPKVLVSHRADRKFAVTLAGRRLIAGSSVYVFARPPAHTRAVKFWLDDPKRLRKPRRVDSAAPFDLIGNSGTAALPYRPKRGTHTVTILSMAADRSTYVMTVTFTATSPFSARFARLG